MSVLESILAVFMEVGEWIPTAITALVPVFWNAQTGLTFMGVLAVSSLAISVIFLIMGIIQRFLHFRG